MEMSKISKVISRVLHRLHQQKKIQNIFFQKAIIEETTEPKTLCIIRGKWLAAILRFTSNHSTQNNIVFPGQ